MDNQPMIDAERQRREYANQFDTVHYAPHGRNALNRFDCGSAVGAYSDVPASVTCEYCKQLSPGLWPPETPTERRYREALEEIRRKFWHMHWTELDRILDEALSPG